MLLEKMVKARLSFVPGKNVQEPNMVLVPSGAKSVAVTVEWAMVSEQNYVIGSEDESSGNLWCVLDANLKQIQHGAGKGRKGTKKAGPTRGRTIQGGGASNPKQIDLELQSSKLKNGGHYTLIASRHGILAAGEFVAVHEPKLKVAKAEKRKTKAKVGKRKVAKRKAAKKKAAKKKAR